ncbi:hypothetical protein KIH77_03395 [Bifidobacterium sp. 82T24]|uniref:hypothetical protein n=1 Tax=Bifidobacterium pluvialisilvae TaxID=2834436 RepID=UPI001C5A3DFE|nr:hypothetical protein [Bifidobacterium pluvialisilvae]MBW3087781.1 hypothetical protein [Bifidobacterium pluvialisilvae]
MEGSSTQILDYDDMTALAEQCRDLVRELDPDSDSVVGLDIDAGEMELAIADALDALSVIPGAASRIPKEVVALTHNPVYTDIHRFNGVF